MPRLVVSAIAVVSVISVIAPLTLAACSSDARQMQDNGDLAVGMSSTDLAGASRDLIGAVADLRGVTFDLAGTETVACPDAPTLADISTPTTVVSTCDEATLRAAVTTGGIVTFDCGGPATITLTSVLEVTKNVTLDGEGAITISGGTTTRIFHLDNGNFDNPQPTLRLQRLVLRDGKAPPGTVTPLGSGLDGGGGAIWHTGGSVVAIEVQFLDNVAAVEGPDVAGGAVNGIGVGDNTFVNCVFSGNRAANGGAIGVLGGNLSIFSSQLVGNTATGYGANYVDGGGNQMGRGGNGGAVSMDGRGKALTICGSVFSQNTGGAYGGAVFRTGYATETNRIDRSTFDDNQVPDSTDDARPSGAGGLYLQGVDVEMTNTTISNNKAHFVGGLWIVGHSFEGSPVPAIANLTNVTVSGNSCWPQPTFTDTALGGGVWIDQNTSGAILNCTIANNSSQFAAGIANVSTMTVRNSIISNNASNLYTPLNCTGTSFASPSGMGDHNLQWPNGPQNDMDCTPSITRADPKLAALTDNGGVTRTMRPADDSPARNAGMNCAPTDQTGKARGATCTLGALE